MTATATRARFDLIENAEELRAAAKLVELALSEVDRLVRLAIDNIDSFDIDRLVPALPSQALADLIRRAMVIRDEGDLDFTETLNDIEEYAAVADFFAARTAKQPNAEES